MFEPLYCSSIFDHQAHTSSDWYKSLRDPIFSSSSINPRSISFSSFSSPSSIFLSFWGKKNLEREHIKNTKKMKKNRKKSEKRSEKKDWKKRKSNQINIFQHHYLHYEGVGLRRLKIIWMMKSCLTVDGGHHYMVYRYGWPELDCTW